MKTSISSADGFSDEDLIGIIETSASPVILNRRIVRRYGQSAIQRAQELAIEIKGSNWLDQAERARIESFSRISSEMQIGDLSGTSTLLGSLNAPSAVLLVGSIVLALVLTFPPFVLQLPNGITLNLGFAFLFDPPLSGGLSANVNSPLLATLLLGVFTITWLIHLAAKLVYVD